MATPEGSCIEIDTAKSGGISTPSVTVNNMVLDGSMKNHICSVLKQSIVSLSSVHPCPVLTQQVFGLSVSAAPEQHREKNDCDCTADIL